MKTGPLQLNFSVVSIAQYISASYMNMMYVASKARNPLWNNHRWEVKIVTSPIQTIHVRSFTNFNRRRKPQKYFLSLIRIIQYTPSLPQANSPPNSNYLRTKPTIILRESNYLRKLPATTTKKNSSLPAIKNSSPRGKIRRALARSDTKTPRSSHKATSKCQRQRLKLASWSGLHLHLAPCGAWKMQKPAMRAGTSGPGWRAVQSGKRRQRASAAPRGKSSRTRLIYGVYISRERAESRSLARIYYSERETCCASRALQARLLTPAGSSGAAAAALSRHSAHVAGVLR